MTVVNVVDHRANKYDVAVDAVAEPAWHDNSCRGATRFPVEPDSLDAHAGLPLTYDELRRVTVAEALARWQAAAGKLTVYLYDAGALEWGTAWDPATGEERRVRIR